MSMEGFQHPSRADIEAQIEFEREYGAKPPQQMIHIEAVIGRESHTTSLGWATLTVNDRQVSYKDAISHKFLTTYGDRHAMWVDCVFAVAAGAVLRWKAGVNTGNRGAIRRRQDLIFRASPDAEVMETEELGYPAKEAVLRGRLVPSGDMLQDAAETHEALRRRL
jgi:hypothetical protein